MSQRAQLATRMSLPVPAVRVMGSKEMQSSIEVRTACFIPPERDIRLWRQILMPIVATRSGLHARWTPD